MTPSIPIIKCHGSENTFFLIDENDLPSSFTEENRMKLSQLLCQATAKWEGADGILIMEKGENSAYKMRIYNADGSEALMCGNGMRVAGRWALEQEAKKETVVENVTHLQYHICFDTDYFEHITATSIVFPPANFNASTFINIKSSTLQQEKVPQFYENYKFTAVAMPNPHIVAIVDDMNIKQLETIGKEANKNKDIFPQGVNVSFVRYINDHKIFVATYERGVGLTNACGTAMLAATITVNKENLVPKNEWVMVQNPGGFIKVNIAEDWSTTMIGNANYVYKTEISALDLENKIFETSPRRYFDTEIKAYDLLKSSL